MKHFMSQTRLSESEIEFENNELKRGWLLLVLLSGFFTGGIAGSFFAKEFEKESLIVPIVVNALLGCAYLVYRVKILRQSLLGEECEETSETRKSARQTHMHSPSRKKNNSTFELVSKGEPEELKI